MLNGLGYTEMALFGIIALMLFGSKLPDVARNFGRSYKELRKKIDEFQREFRDWDRADSASTPKLPKYTADDDVQRIEPSAPKFVPPPSDDDDD